jgi:hypothetical protein
MRLGEVADDAELAGRRLLRRLDAFGVAAGHDHARALVSKDAGDRQTDAPGRPGHHADLVAEAEIHGRVAYRRDHHPPCPPRGERLEP